jgi:hypothetical protein
MDNRRIGLAIRQLRRRRRWRQIDLAAAAGVSQALISLVERGHLASATIHTLRSILSPLEARLDLVVGWRGGAIDRLLDERHATIVNLVVGILTVLGWTIAVEVSFNHYGDRGSIDILAWHPLFRTVLVIEVKSEITSIEELTRRLDVKTRLARDLASDRGWRPDHIATLVVLPEGTAARTALRRFGAVFSAAYPARGREVRSWLRRPAGPLRGIWLLTPSTTSSGKRTGASPTRVRLPRQAK